MLRKLTLYNIYKFEGKATMPQERIRMPEAGNTADYTKCKDDSYIYQTHLDT